MCCNNTPKPTPANESCSCLKKTFDTIAELQNQASIIDNIDESCNKPFLGPCNAPLYNTRPVMLKNCDGSQVTFSDNTNTYDTFRVESVDGCCVTLRGLVAPVNGDTAFQRSSFCVTTDMNCLGAIQCLQDTYIECI